MFLDFAEAEEGGDPGSEDPEGGHRLRAILGGFWGLGVLGFRGLGF